MTNQSPEATIRAALEAWNERPAIKPGDTAYTIEVLRTHRDMALDFNDACSPSNITALLSELDALRKDKQEQALQYLTDQGQWIEETGRLIAERDAAIARAEAAEADLAPLQDFFDAVVGEFPDHGDVDGFYLQELAESLGFLKAETITAPCGEVCSCADCGVEGETTCYRVKPIMRRARTASARRYAQKQTRQPESHQGTQENPPEGE